MRWRQPGRAHSRGQREVRSAAFERSRSLRPSRRARRAQIRRRRAGFVLVLGGVGLGVFALVAGSGPQHHASAQAPQTPSRAALARRGAPRTPVATRPGPATGSAEPAEVRRLVALGRPIYCAGRRGDEVALTFDDGPGPYTRLVIDKLRKHHLHATFFVVGRNITLVPGATRAERALGAVGDHTFTHPLLTELAPSQAEREIVITQHALARSSGGPVFLFRPPYGGRDATIDAIAREHGLLEIMWTVDSADSLGADWAQIEHNVIAGLRPGSIILMHENHGQTVRALLGIFAALQRKHLRAVSVPQLLADDPPSAAQLRSVGGGCGAASGTSLGSG